MFLHDINPVFLRIGPLQIRWYGLMYIFGIAIGWFLGRKRAKQNGLTTAEVDDLITYLVAGILLGARLGQVFFYEPQYYFADPMRIFKIWEGGMSFHGGVIGVILAFWLFARRHKKTFLRMGDFVAPLIPPGLFFGRMGNFINGELWGNVTDVPWAFVFPMGGFVPRHPSQLYEAFLEGIVLFLILWIFSEKHRPTGAVSGLFLLCYGVFRSFVEFFREPADLGYLAFGWITMGQILCTPMIIAGIWLLYRAYWVKRV